MRRRRFAVTVVTIGVAGLAAGAFVGLGLGGRNGSGTPRTVNVVVDEGRHGARVPPSFLGLSIEWDSVLPYTGPADGRRTALLDLLAPLAHAAGSPLALRIGGDTTDQAWWNPGRRARPATVLQDIGPATLDAITWLARGLHAPVTLGLNLALDDPGNTVLLARAAGRRLPAGALEAVEIGNEPDLYTHERAFRRGGHLHRRLRKRATYGPAEYGRDVARYLSLLSAGLRAAPRLDVGGLAGPAWWPALPTLLERWAPRAGAVTGHLYAVPNCSARTPPRSWLMAPDASRDRVATLLPLAAIAGRRRLPFVVSELNSAACGGRSGFSETPAAALWLADTLFWILRSGARRADVHTWRGAIYAPFVVTAHGAKARPPLDGMAAFARAAPAGSHLVDVMVRGAGGTRTAALRAWATVDRRGTQRVALLAPDAVRAEVVAPARGCARLWRPRRTVRVCPTSGRYRVALGPASVAVLTVAR